MRQRKSNENYINRSIGGRKSNRKLRLSSKSLLALSLIVITLINLLSMIENLSVSASGECDQGHDYQLIVHDHIDPTCVEDGYDRYVCSVCGNELKNIIPALGHRWGSWFVEVAPTCKDSGTEIRICENDPTHKETRDVPPHNNHDYRFDRVIPPTCEVDGYDRYICNVCGNELKNIIPALGHRWDGWVLIGAPATCTEPSTEMRICLNDSAHKETRVSSPHGHDYGPWIITIPPTITTEGMETSICRFDPSHIKTRSIPPLEPVVTYTISYLPGTRGMFTTVTYGGLELGTATPTAPTATGQVGWKFIGWNPVVSATVTGNATYTAQWEQIPYTVTYLPGLHGTFTAQTTGNLTYGTATPTAPTATGQTGWKFIGWNPEVSTTVTGNAIYTAQWEEVVTPVVTYYTVRYLPGTRGTFTTVTYGSLESGAATPGAPAVTGQTGYTFTGWSPVRTSIVTGNIDYVAQWTQAALPTVNYTVTFVDFDGRELKVEEVEEGSSASAPTVPTRTGYRFTSWDRAFTNVRSNITVTAQYEEVSTTTTTTTSFTVTFVDFDGRVLKIEEVTSGGNASAPVNPSRAGYNFTDWLGAFTNVRENVTVTAQYSVIDTTVSTITPIVNPTPEEVINQLKEEGIPTMTLGGLEIPLSGGSMSKYVWALANLILTISGLIFGIIAVIRITIKKNRNDDEVEEYNFYSAEEKEEQKKKKMLWFVITLIMSVAGLVVFILTENIKQPMVVLDKWTIVNASILVLEIISFILISKKKKMTI